MPPGILSPEPTHLTFIRHAQSVANLERCFGGHSQTPLTRLGRTQASRLAEHLAGRAADVLYASDLERAKQTALPLADCLNLPLHLEAGLRERSVGELDGKAFRVAQEERPEIWQGLLSRDPDYRPPGGESAREAHARIGNTLQTLVQRHQGQRLVLVSHGILIHLGLNALLGRDAEDAMASYFPVGNTALCEVQLGPKRLTLESFNQQHHL